MKAYDIADEILDAVTGMAQSQDRIEDAVLKTKELTKEELECLVSALAHYMVGANKRYRRDKV